MRKLGSSILIMLSTLTLSQGRTDRAYGAPLLATTRSFEVGGSPFSVAAGDLNRDGKPDVATANANGTVSVLLGNGDGTFQTKVDYAAGTSASSIVIEDLNRDAKPDLVTRNAGLVSVLLGNGDGTFQARTDYPTGGEAYDRAHSLATGDFNRDGNRDLATANGSNVSVFMGAGDGTFNARVDYSAGGSLCIAIADVNRDTKQDLVTTDAYTVTVLLGGGDGSFKASAQYPARSGRISANQAGSPRRSRNSAEAYWGNDLALAAGDVNGDGTPDLAIVTFETFKNESFVAVLLGRGDGTFQTHVDYPVLDYPSGIAIGDVSGDGTPDVVTANDWSGTVSILVGRGDGTFPTRVDYGSGGAPFAVVIGDVSGDGRLDIVTSNSSNSVSILLADEHGAFLARRDYAVGRTPYLAAIGDVDGDGKLDVASANWDESTVSILFGNGDGTLGGRTDLASRTPYHVAIGDMNGDGKGDVAATSDDNTMVSVFLSSAGRTFAPKTEYSFDGRYFVVIADVSGDQKPDLVGSADAAVSVLLGNGDGTFQTKVNYGTGPYPDCAAVADVNGDNRADIVTGNYNGSLSVLLGNGDGTFQTHVDYGTGSSRGSVAIGDLNGDGRPDLASGTLTTGGVSVLLGNGDGTFQPKVDYAAGRSLFRVGIADMNGDAKPDLVATELAAVVVLPGSGDGTFGAPVDNEGGRGVVSVAIGDMDRDGNPDVVTANRACETVSILRNINGRQPILNARVHFDPGVISSDNHAKWVTATIEPVGFGPADIAIAGLRLAGSISPASKFAQVGDRDRNGRPDLMVRFSRQALNPLLVSGVNQLEVTGSLVTGASFSGSGTVRVTGSEGSSTIASVAPNPVNPGGSLSFYVGTAGPVRIRVFDRGGRLVRTMLDAAAMEVGAHHLAIDGRGDRGTQMASGVYFYKIETADGIARGRFTVLK